MGMKRHELREILRDFILIRKGKHVVYRHRVTGKRLTTSVSPSDYNALRQIAREARRKSQ